jgi:hypothetical protein
MKDNQHEQLFTELDPVFEEISDDNSASLTGGARGDFAGTIPSVGATTFPEVYTTTSEFNDISIRLNQDIPYPITVKAVRADGSGDVSTFARTIKPYSKGDLVTVAADVRDGTRFKLSFGAPTTLTSFNISGPITY